MSGLLCGIKAFRRKLEGDLKLSAKDKDRIAKRLDNLAKDWDTGKNFNNVKEAGWNNFDTFEWLWKKYTHLPALDPSEFPINYKHLRKFEVGLKFYNELVAKPRGVFASKFHLPRAAMQNFPELMRFETNLTNETQFFRDYSNSTNKNINDFLSHFKNLALSLGESSRFVRKVPLIRGVISGGQKKLSKLQKEYSLLTEQFLHTTSPKQKADISSKLRANRMEIKKFYETGSGKAFEFMNNVLQGTDISTITEWIDKDGETHKITAEQRIDLQKIKSNYIDIRKAGALSLIRGLQKIKSMAKEKDLGWVDNTVERINGLIKAIEFQKTVDESGKTIDYKDMQSERDFLKLGFKTKDISRNGKVAFSKHYMSQYTLGILRTIKKVEADVENGKLSLDEKIETEINSWDNIVNVAKGRSPIANPVYDNDPYFFLKKYVSDVGIFNYKLHLKDNFTNAANSIIKEHLNPAKEAGRKDLEEASWGLLDLINDVYSEIQMRDPGDQPHMMNVMRTMQAVTYFRLMGGNVRSATRNGTQRAYEWVEFGFKASLWDSKKFYKDVGGAENNQVKLNRQLKKYGLQWFDGKSKTSNAWDSLTGKDINVSQQSRGALEDAYMLDKDVYINKDDELVMRDSDSWSAKTARGSSGFAKSMGKLHKIMEDWNRGKTMKVGFALASMNLEQTSTTWRAQQILEKHASSIRKKKGDDYIITEKDLIERYGSDAEKVMSDWIENKAGQLAHSGVLDLHFEYAKWNKARAIKVTGKEKTATAMAKMGFGQFAHYRFNMVNLMHKWLKEGGLSVRARDFSSEEFMRPIRFGMLQALLWGATIAGRTNFQKLMPNDVIETGEALYLHANVQAKLALGDITEEQIQRIAEDRTGNLYLKIPHGKLIRNYIKKTYGQRGKYFAGPNAPIIFGAYELVAKANLDGHVDPRTEDAFDTAFRHMKKDEQQEKYESLYWINSQLARTVAYTIPGMTGGSSLGEAGYQELGLFPSKEQREWTRWLYGTKKKKRKKIFKQDMSQYDIDAAIRAVNKIPSA